MKCHFATDTSLPGGFVIEAENAVEAQLLRTFVNWPGQHANPLRLEFANHGGNIGEGRYSFMLKWVESREKLQGHELALDTDLSDTYRAIHRVVRAMNDGECPRCHVLDPEDVTFTPGMGWDCNRCNFHIGFADAQHAMALFAPKMEAALALYERWRKGLERPPRRSAGSGPNGQGDTLDGSDP